MTSAQVLGGRVGGYRRWARTSDRSAATAPARAAFIKRFELQVDPDGKLSDRERTLRADAARSAYYAELALKRHQGRRRK